MIWNKQLFLRTPQREREREGERERERERQRETEMEIEKIEHCWAFVGSINRALLQNSARVH